MPGASVIYSIIWLVVLVIFLLVEAATAGLVSIWFCVGALASIIAALCNAGVWVQLLVFIFVSLLALAFTRPIVKKFIKPRLHPTNVDAIIGKTAVVTERVDNVLATGKAKVDGNEWTARSYDDSIIEENERATVEKIEGVKIYIKKI